MLRRELVYLKNEKDIYIPLVGMYILHMKSINRFRCSLVLLTSLIFPVAGAESSMEIEKSYQINYPVDVVYRAWVSSDTVIPPATSMDVLPEVGGHYRLIMEMPEFVGKNEGVFKLVEPEKRVVYTWEWNDDGEVTTIDVQFSDAESGTKIDLKHTGFTKPESVTNHDSGWDSYMDGFVKHLDSL